MYTDCGVRSYVSDARLFTTAFTRQYVLLFGVTDCELSLTVLQSDPRSFIVRKTADEVFKVYVVTI